MILLSSSLNSFIQLLGVLLIFLFVLVITYFTTKWIGGYQKVQMSGRSFQVSIPYGSPTTNWFR